MIVGGLKITVRARAIALLALLAAGAASGCGKKGPPLAPLRPAPAPVASFTVKRVADTVYVRFTVPPFTPGVPLSADLDRVDLYAFTGYAAEDLDDPDLLTRIGSVQVRDPVTPEQEERWKRTGVPPPPNPGVDVGTVVDLSEPLTADLRVPITPRRVRPRPRPAAEMRFNLLGYSLDLPLAGPVVRERPLRRFYFAQTVSRKRVEGALKPIGTVSLGPPPPPPEAPEGETAETGVTLTWALSPAHRLPIQEPVPAAPAAAAPAADTAAPGPPAPLPSTPKGMPPAPEYAFNVYLISDVPAPADPTVVPPPAPYLLSGEHLPVPLNPTPLAVQTFLDGAIVFGVERCYVVRTVEKADGLATEGDPSPSYCVTPVDEYPPPVPQSLAAVASEGAISLIWDSVEAPDLAGYIVFRSDGPDAPLVPLFEEPIRETTYRDTTARPGVRYSYAVASVDTATPRNVSAPSSRVEEAAR